MVKRNGRKEKVINDLKEGGKILEDQSRLMDEKYMELRMKLDWTRIQTERIIKRKEEEVRQLRAKFVLINDMANKSTKVRNKLSYWWISARGPFSTNVNVSFLLDLFIIRLRPYFWTTMNFRHTKQEKVPTLLIKESQQRRRI